MSTPLISLHHDSSGIFRPRPNRFLGMVEIDRQEHKVHIHDPGRLKELLLTGNRVVLKRVESPTRKTRWDVLAVRRDKQWVLVHSGHHRAITEALLGNPAINPFGKVEAIRPEIKLGHSRLDFLLTQKNGQKVYVEVKGCTLTINGTALFPDAPTVRGTKHLESLMEARRGGAKAAVLILVFRNDSKCFAPNTAMDPKFSDTFKRAVNAGVEVYPLMINYDKREVYYQTRIPVCTEFR